MTETGDPGSGEPGGGTEEPLTGTAADDRARLSGVEDRISNLERRERAARAAARAAATTAEQPPPAAAGKPAYATLVAYVEDSFAPTYTRRRAGGRWNWCALWYEHDEAVVRLQALWKSWEALHAKDATSLGEWHRNHLDHQLPILLGPDGPFRDCVDRHWPTEDGDLLRCETPPTDNRVWQTE